MLGEAPAPGRSGPLGFTRQFFGLCSQHDGVTSWCVQMHSPTLTPGGAKTEWLGRGAPPKTRSLPLTSAIVSSETEKVSGAGFDPEPSRPGSAQRQAPAQRDEAAASSAPAQLKVNESSVGLLFKHTILDASERLCVFSHM